jgi:hypothetical protein
MIIYQNPFALRTAAVPSFEVFEVNDGSGGFETFEVSNGIGGF